MPFTPRTTAPDVTNKYYRHTGYYDNGVDGLNECLIIDNNTGFVMPNCVGYSWGRWYEAFGGRPRLSRGDAYLWYGYTADGYARSTTTPQLGAVACFYDAQHPTSGGHVMSIEYIVDSTLCITSNSAYNSTLFWTEDITWDNDAQTWKRDYQPDRYIFQGFILPQGAGGSGIDKLILFGAGNRRFPNGRSRIPNNRRF